MPKRQSLLFVLKQSSVCYQMICMIVPLTRIVISCDYESVKYNVTLAIVEVLPPYYLLFTKMID